jgi:hypothetical protein
MVEAYSETVKNITISLPDDIYRRARVMAAERDTSVSALVKEYLMKLGNEESDFDRRKRLQAEVLASIKSFRAGDRLARDAAHDRSSRDEAHGRDGLR